MICKKAILIFFVNVFLSVERNANAQSQSITFNYSDYQQAWQIPSGVTQITITAIGAAGGAGTAIGGFGSGGGGNGATIVGYVTVTPRDVLDIFTGGAGSNGDYGGGGGGGGTFIYDAASDTLLEAAGGGGGNGNNGNGYNASTTTIPNPSNSGGTKENGGSAFSSSGGGGGAGFRGNGATYSPNYNGSVGTGGNDFANGFTGGTGGVGPGIGVGGANTGGNGGYGGGGGGGYIGAGGGGGYAGGGCSSIYGGGGGGGSSFVTNNGILSSADTNAGNGSVTITWVAPTGIGDITSATEQIIVYPNPSNGKFNLGVSGKEQEISEIEVEIYNILGEKVYSSQYSTLNNQYLINLSSQPNGIYLYNTMDANGNLLGQGKLTIQR